MQETKVTQQNKTKIKENIVFSPSHPFQQTHEQFPNFKT